MTSCSSFPASLSITFQNYGYDFPSVISFLSLPATAGTSLESIIGAEVREKGIDFYLKITQKTEMRW
jgi:uncharacterized membrane protein